MLAYIAKTDFHSFYEKILHDCNLIKNMTSIMLDSDNLLSKQKDTMNDKQLIMQSVFLFIRELTSDEMTDNHQDYVREILKTIYEQPGLINNIIFNLNQPKDDDPLVLSS